VRADLERCMPAQSVVHKAFLWNASDITCLSSAWASVLFTSVICPRHFATHSLFLRRPGKRCPVERAEIRTLTPVATILSTLGQMGVFVTCLWRGMARG
jgi:hypothetical protein